MAEIGGRSSWLAVWTKAVIGPAYRRAGAVWTGVAILSAVLFGPTGLMPHDLTQLALHEPGVATMLGVTWLLVFVPVARVIVRADGARYLRSLPGPTAAPLAIAIAALIGLQLPWLALWVLGEGARGLAIVAAHSLVVVAIASWQPPRARTRSGATTLRGVYLRALRRRAGDAIVRGVGLAILAGLAGGLLVRNNHLAGSEAAVLGTGVITVAILPAEAALLVVLLEAHRASAWLAASLGVDHRARVATLATAVAVVYAAGAAIALVTAAVVIAADAATVAWLAAIALVVAVASALAVTRGIVAAEASALAAQRVVIAAVAIAAIAVIWLGLLDVLGAAAMAATGAVAMATAPGGDAA